MEVNQIDTEKFGIEITKAARKLMRAAAVEREITLGSAYEAACRLWTSGDAAASLAAIIASGDANLITQAENALAPLRLQIGRLKPDIQSVPVRMGGTKVKRA